MTQGFTPYPSTQGIGCRKSAKPQDLKVLDTFGASGHYNVFLPV